MKKKIFILTAVFMLTLLSTGLAQMRWQKIITTDAYRYYFDSSTISYGQMAILNQEKTSKIDKNVIVFLAQKVYWNPQDTITILQQINNNIDWTAMTYSVGQYKYDINNNNLWQGDISFFTNDGRMLGTVHRNIWNDIGKSSDEERICQYLMKYAKENNQSLKDHT